MKITEAENLKPQEIISRDKEKQARINFVKAVLLDIFLVFYTLLLLQRVIYYKFILSLRETPFSWYQIASVLALSIVIGTVWAFTGTSLSMRLFKLHKDNKVTKWSVEIFAWLLFDLTFIAGWVVTKISIIDIFSAEGIRGAERIFGAMFHPNMAIFDDALSAIIETIYLALIATLLSIPPTFVLSFLTARNLMRDNKITFAIYYVLRIIFNFIRSIEPLIWAIIFSVWVGIGPYAGMIALLVHSIASNAKLYSEAIEGIEQGPVEAIVATGANKIQVVWYAVVPQITLPFLSFTIYRWDINVRMATIIGLVGGGGIGTMLMQYQGLARWNEVGLIVIMIAFVVWVMDYISAKIREAIY
ncbi:MAG: phosphonate ABC transporter, permease protein PhnE [Ignavibacteria bacterium]|jgi:phosphonate transport system permease protein|nr:phosphonate ABC transporter, permease protein PhnE [Ignavibacteria bacterium]MCU7497951.1 phosphonate ABC transporter, permease protein PhnE [Ignavibacteria bacterium]MCU7514387.1 phosphonate ABC transporter, permease protein PhnE [Ignavibacteria bacterium]MCU7519837.1 phosphonate ABC transporter, permease protein PhnE [Ignavibacteria bacterium]MCU7524098.1 phosphonate ABC transporter, permease protein PhnE [Ignavibacteria bacterium]